MKHPAPETIDAYVNGELGLLASLRCRLHLNSCPECQKIEQKCREEQAFIKEVKDAVELDKPLDNPELFQRLSSHFDSIQKS